MPARKKTKPSTKPVSNAGKANKAEANKISSHARVAEAAAQPYNAGVRETRISASEFKARCLELMDTVRDRHETIIITKHGTPVAKLVPFEDELPNAVGYMCGSVLWYGDLISPIDVEWDANK